jgi:hypothetical protein
MSMDKPFRAGVAVDAPRDVVWRRRPNPNRSATGSAGTTTVSTTRSASPSFAHATLVPPRLIEFLAEPWHSSRHQRGADVDGDLAIVFAKPRGGKGMLPVTTYDLDDDAFTAAEERWNA